MLPCADLFTRTRQRQYPLPPPRRRVLKICVFNDYRLGVLRGDDHVVDISDVAGVANGTPWAMNALITGFDDHRLEIERAAESEDGLSVDDVALRPANPQPRQVLAAPLNYGGHVNEMAPGDANVPTEPTARDLGFFVKAGGSISGPADPIEVPNLPGREFHHEVELGIVFGRTARSVRRDDALKHIFGYTCMLDITMRMTDTHREERTMRKSFHSFTPCGPVIVTADEVADPNQLQMKLWVNGELRQDGSTADMICGVEELVEQASRVVALHPGDLYATGTPDGVGAILPGDDVRVWIERVGEMTLRVTRRQW